MEDITKANIFAKLTFYVYYLWNLYFYFAFLLFNIIQK